MEIWDEIDAFFREEVTWQLTSGRQILLISHHNFCDQCEIEQYFSKCAIHILVYK